jgi:hypothetical protein
VDAKQKQFVDELLEASLRRYASAEPRPGLEGRVLAGVRARQEATRRRTMWTWAVGMAGVAAMVTLLVIYRPHRQPAPSPVAAKAPANVSAPAAAKIAPPEQPPLPHRPRRPAVVSRIDTRPQQFPTPRPLSEQEKLLLVYVKSLEASSEVSVPATDQRSDQDLEIPPIRIATIRIEPLDPLDSGEAK